MSDVLPLSTVRRGALDAIHGLIGGVQDFFGGLFGAANRGHADADADAEQAAQAVQAMQAQPVEADAVVQ